MYILAAARKTGRWAWPGVFATGTCAPAGLAAAIEAMLLRLLCAADTPAADAAPLVLDNHAWLGELRVTELLTGAGRHMRMGAMLGKENVRSRLAPGGAGLSFAEFAYPLLQVRGRPFESRPRLPAGASASTSPSTSRCTRSTETSTSSRTPPPPSWTRLICAR